MVGEEAGLQTASLLDSAGTVDKVKPVDTRQQETEVVADDLESRLAALRR